MRIIYLIVLLLVLGAVGDFVYENGETMELQFFHHIVSCQRSLLIAVVYVLGMVSGWVVLGLIRRSLRGATDLSAR